MIARALAIALALSVACSGWLWWRMDAARDELAQVRADAVVAALAYSENVRNRPDRVPGTTDAPRTACAGATGAELSGPDAVFLVGLAARADELRAELGACQQREHAGWPVSQP